MALRVRFAHSAFTLVELLIVLGILALLLGLGVAAIVSQPRTNRMIAAEQVLSDIIRQARHTARTSGQPVTVRIQKNERIISGLVRKTLWHQAEDWPIAPLGASGPDMPQPGRTGYGLILPGAYHSWDPLRIALATARLDGGYRLWRGSPNAKPGLLLSLAVRPPVATASITADGHILPLVLVGPEDDAAPLTDAKDFSRTFAAYDSSFLGLALVQTNDPTIGGTGIAPSWEILGWYNDGAGGGISISSIKHQPADMPNGTLGLTTAYTTVKDTASGDISGLAESGPLVGGRWTEISLLVDGDRLVMYRDGRRVAERLGAAAVVIDESGVPAERVYVGVMKCAALAPKPGIPAPFLYVATANIDDVRLERLGDALSSTLPSGVMPDADHRITCHPDGRVEVDGNGTTTTIALSALSGEGATVVVSIDGALTTTISKQATPP